MNEKKKKMDERKNEKKSWVKKGRLPEQRFHLKNMNSAKPCKTYIQVHQ